MACTEIQEPSRFCSQWAAVVIHRSGAEVQARYFDTAAEALAQAHAWEDEADRTGHLPGCPAASYES